MRPAGTGIDLVARRADGTTFPVDVMLNSLQHLAGPMMLAVVRDMTERRAAEEALRQSQARLVAIVTSSEDAIIGKTLDGIVTSWNEAAERMFGYSASEMIGQSIPRLFPTDRQAEEDVILRHVAQGERVEHYETVRNTKDGRAIDVSVTAAVAVILVAVAVGQCLPLVGICGKSKCFQAWNANICSVSCGALLQ
jgi:PAS domain S-box-containing protein